MRSTRKKSPLSPKKQVKRSTFSKIRAKNPTFSQKARKKVHIRPEKHPPKSRPGYGPVYGIVNSLCHLDSVCNGGNPETCWHGRWTKCQTGHKNVPTCQWRITLLLDVMTCRVRSVTYPVLVSLACYTIAYVTETHYVCLVLSATFSWCCYLLVACNWVYFV